jgi:hypothetical protein
MKPRDETGQQPHNMPAHATYICAFDVYTLHITRAGGGGGGGVSYW